MAGVGNTTQPFSRRFIIKTDNETTIGTGVYEIPSKNGNKNNHDFELVLHWRSLARLVVISKQDQTKGFLLDRMMIEIDKHIYILVL